MKYALGENVRVAKFASRLLASLKGCEEQCIEVIEVYPITLGCLAHSTIFSP